MSSGKTCVQCGKPAVAQLGEHPICLDHYLALQQTEHTRFAREAARANHAIEMMEASTGVYGFPRIQAPQAGPNFNTGNTNYHNVSLSNSVVGAVNTGYVQRLNVAVSTLSQAGQEELADSLKRFSEALLSSRELESEVRTRVLEQLDYLTSGATFQSPKSVVASILKGIRDSVTTSSALMGLWEKLEPLMKEAIGQ